MKKKLIASVRLQNHIYKSSYLIDRHKHKGKPTCDGVRSHISIAGSISIRTIHPSQIGRQVVQGYLFNEWDAILFEIPPLK